MFEKEEIGGVYWKSGKDENNETYYKKEDPTRFLSRKVVGRWTISKYLNNQFHLTLGYLPIPYSYQID